MTQNVIIRSLQILRDYDVESDPLSRLIAVYRFLQDDGIECKQLQDTIEDKRDGEYEDAHESLEDAIKFLERLRQ